MRQVAHREQLAFFRSLISKKGGRAGQRFYMTLVELGDDERPVDQAKRRQMEEATKGGALSKHAARLCRDSEFQRWIAEAEGMDCADVDERFAAEWVRGTCEVDTRAKLDHDARAAQRYENLVRRPFVEWLGDTGAW